MKKIDFLFVPYKNIDSKTIVIVIDVIRASSTIVTFFGLGGERLFVRDSIEEAFRLKDRLNSEGWLAGERGGLKIEGFDLDNSPYELLKYQVKGKSLVLTTTNGTKTIAKYKNVPYLFIGAFLNLSYLTEVVFTLSESTGFDISVVCSGKEGEFVLDDLLCGGAFVDKFLGKGEFLLTDAAKCAWDLFRSKRDMIKGCLFESSSGKNIVRFGKTKDIEFLSNIDRYKVAPYLSNREGLFIEDYIKLLEWGK